MFSIEYYFVLIDPCVESTDRTMMVLKEVYHSPQVAKCTARGLQIIGVML